MQNLPGAGDGVIIPQDPVNGWQYDPNTNTVYMNGTSLPQAGSYMTVTYPGAGVCP